MVDTPTKVGTDLLDETDVTVYTMASRTPPGNKLILIAISLLDSGAPALTSVIGNGITYAEIANAAYDLSGQLGTIFLYRGMAASPTTGTIVITATGASEGCAASMWVVGGVKTGNNGADAIQQSDSNVAAASNVAALLTTFQSGSVTFAVVGNDEDEDHTPDSPLVKLNQIRMTSDRDTQSVHWFNGQDLTPSVEADTSGNMGIVAIEILAAPVAATGFTPRVMVV